MASGEAPPPARGDRPRLDARTTAWFLAQRERVHALELEAARLEGELAASERIERSAQRYADKLEEKLATAQKREATLARALGYAEAQRDDLAKRLGAAPRQTPIELAEREIVPHAKPVLPARRP